MHIALLCAGLRGARVLERLIALTSGARLTVATFREEPGEPPFLDRIRAIAEAAGARFVEARTIAAAQIGEGDDRPDLLFAVGWRYMIAPAVYQTCRIGAFTFHDSLLPAYRGFAPTVWSILNDEPETGATLFHMAADVDSGDIVAQKPAPIGEDDTIATVMDRVTERYLDLLETNLPLILAGNAPRAPQDHSAATYTCKLTEADAEIDWSAPTRRIYNLIRGVSRPYWGAWTRLGDRKLRIWEARNLRGLPPYVGRVPGRLVQSIPGTGAVVLTGDGGLLITRVQLDGCDEAPAETVLNSIRQTLGRRG